MSRSGVDFRPAAAADAAALAAAMREADRQEVAATSGPDILAAVVRSMAVTPDCMAAERGSALVALFGVAPISLLEGIGSPWMLGTTALERIPGALTRSVRHYLVGMLRAYPILVNHVDARNTASVRWLWRLGFAIYAPEPFGVLGLPFHRFEMRA